MQAVKQFGISTSACTERQSVMLVLQIFRYHSSSDGSEHRIKNFAKTLYFLHDFKIPLQFKRMAVRICNNSQCFECIEKRSTASKPVKKVK